MPKLSIITINYNNLEGLKRTVESVVNQTWQEFEYIIIDGGSTDGSAAYIESQNTHFDYWVSEPDKGIYNAMNKGILKATGEYLLFLNSGDDFFSDTVLEENHNQIEGYDLVYFNIKIVEGGTSKIVSYPKKLKFSYFYLGSICHQSIVFKKNLFDKIGYYDEELKIMSDWKFFIVALFNYHCSYLKVNVTLCTFYMDGLSSDPANNQIHSNERLHVLNNEFKNSIDDFKELQQLRQIVSSFKKSRKISWLVKLGLLNKF